MYLFRFGENESEESDFGLAVVVGSVVATADILPIFNVDDDEYDDDGIKNETWS